MQIRPVCSSKCYVFTLGRHLADTHAKFVMLADNLCMTQDQIQGSLIFADGGLQRYSQAPSKYPVVCGGDESQGTRALPGFKAQTSSVSILYLGLSLYVSEPSFVAELDL